MIGLACLGADIECAPDDPAPPLQEQTWPTSLHATREGKATFYSAENGGFGALTGIGARIEMDDTGLPKIRETTILSAVDSSGMVAAGDYISGMVKEDGTVLNFNGMSLQQIVRNLRGEAGSEIEIMIERTGPGGRIHMTVPIQRSLIVMQPFTN